MNDYTVTSKLLQGLGKPTRRGIKKCRKCGVYNGTRGVFCKNKRCGVSLKTADNPAYEVDAVKLITGTGRQVYSVRVKDMISEYRGFVQLPLLQSTLEDNRILSNAALCFVDSCQRSFDNSILKCHEEGQGGSGIGVCDHINLALKSQTVAKAIIFDPYILRSLKIPHEVLQKLSILAADSGCPLVQRVSKNVMAVKCQVTSKQPLGYLHFTIVRGKNKGYEKYCCDCTEYVSSVPKPQQTNIKHRCIHYYACIAALSSNPIYLEEYSYFINDDVTKRKSKNFNEETEIFDTAMQKNCAKNVSYRNQSFG